TPGRLSSAGASTAPLLPVTPMAVREAPGMGWALKPRASMDRTTPLISSWVASCRMTTSTRVLLKGALYAQRRLTYHSPHAPAAAVPDEVAGRADRRDQRREPAAPPHPGSRQPDRARHRRHHRRRHLRLHRDRGGGR